MDRIIDDFHEDFCDFDANTFISLDSMLSNNNYVPHWNLPIAANDEGLQVPSSSVEECQISLAPMAGIYNFNVFLPQGSEQKGWCFSETLDTLFVKRDVVLAISYKMQEWIPAVIEIMPVYSNSDSSMYPVKRCYNCIVKDPNPDVAHHIVRFVEDGCKAAYTEHNGRTLVAVPVAQPPNGEDKTKLYLKIMCFTSCVGGPNRRPFSLVFSLKYNNSVVGRQVLNIRCCSCPLRDMELKEMEMAVKTATSVKDEAKVNNPAPSETQYITLVIEAKYAKKVKRYYNALIALSGTCRKKRKLLPFPECLSSETEREDSA